MSAAMSAYQRRSVLLTGITLGIGIVGFVDEAVLHQVLQWHTFYWSTDEHGRILSDGVFHIFSTLVLLWGVYRLWSSRSRLRDNGQELVAAILVGAGGFNTFDGIVDHLVLHIHLVNERVCSVVDANNSVLSCPQDIPFEIGFTLLGLLMLTSGIVGWRRAAARVD
ncbi:MAG: DUF2243 domain-containing protein [Chloroflexota bacterium]